MPQTDVSVNRLDFDMDPVAAEIPVMLNVATLEALLTNRWLEKMVKLGLSQSEGKLPVEVTYEDSTFAGNQAEVTVKAGAGRFLKASATVCVELSGAGANKLMARVAEIKALGMLPIEGIVNPVIDKMIIKASQVPGVEAHPSESRAVLIDPNLLLGWKEAPLRFREPGMWVIVGAPQALKVTFSTS